MEGQAGDVVWAPLEIGHGGQLWLVLIISRELSN